MNGLGFVPLAFLLAAAVAALATPAVSRLALLVGAVDRPNERKVSRRAAMPLMGGIAVALGFFVGLAAALLRLEDVEAIATPVEILAVGGLLMLMLGAVDDRFGLGALSKLVAQIGAAGLAIAAGFRIDHFTDPFTMQVFHFPEWLVYLLSGAWIIVVTNSINLIDGLDGLATGVSAIIATTLTVIAFQGGHLPGIIVGTALVGALLGFLPFNFPPARIFVGDTGALFIGYVLALLSLEGYQRVTLITFIVPLLALAVPLLDTGLSVLRRLRRGGHIMQADREHMHHRLLDVEGSHRPAVLSLYFLTACFCIIAVSFTRLHGVAALVFLAVVVVLTLRILRNLGFFELGEEIRAKGPGEAPAENEEEGRRAAGAGAGGASRQVPGPGALRAEPKGEHR